MAVSVMWAIWSSRNKYAHDEVKYQPGKSMILIQELIHGLYIPSQKGDEGRKEKAKWKPPEEGWVKINTDAAIDNIAGVAATGVVARDHGGRVVVARTTKIPQMTDAYAAELLAVRDTSALAVEKGWQKVVIETDLPNNM